MSTWDIGVGAFFHRLQEASRAVRRYGEENTHDQARDDVLVAALHPNATFTVCTFVLNPEATKTLLVRHPKFGWVAPGGHVEGAESPSDAARRELAEETGVTTAHYRPTPACLSYGAKRLAMIGYVAYVSETVELVPETDAAWFVLDALPVSVFIDDPERLRNAIADVPPAPGPYSLTVTANDHLLEDRRTTQFDNLEDALQAWSTQQASDLEAERRWGYRPNRIRLDGATS